MKKITTLEFLSNLVFFCWNSNTDQTICSPGGMTTGYLVTRAGFTTLSQSQAGETDCEQIHCWSNNPFFFLASVS